MCLINIAVYLIILNSCYSYGAKILALYPLPSISHQFYYRSLTLELIKRGHEVTVLTTNPLFTNETAPKNLREIDVHDISYRLWNSFYEMPVGKSDYLVVQMQTAYKANADIFKAHVENEAIKKILENKNETYDLLLFDGFITYPLIFSHIYKIPAIAVNSLGAVHGNYETIGAVVNEAHFPSNVGSGAPKNRIQMLQALYNYYYNMYHVQWYIEKLQNIAVKNAFGAHMPDVRELKKNINMLFINLYSAWDSNRPAPISLKYMGGLHTVSETPLPEDIKSYLDSSKNGVIYMSLGTNVKSSRLSKKHVEIFNKVFSELPYDVLWKWDYETMPNKPKNVRIFKWLPQSVVLKHPKVKLFVTQGGLQSTDEAITAGVPMIGIPMLVDQWFNTEKYERYNIGLQLNFETLAEDSFRNAVHTITRNKSFYTNIINHRNLMHDQPQKVLDRAVSWIEYVIKNGGSHLQAPAANMSWAEYVELELIFIVIGFLMSALIGMYLVLKYLWKVFHISIFSKYKVI